MQILDQVKIDAEILIGFIDKLRSGGSRLTGDALKDAEYSSVVALKKLELIIESGVIPEAYVSIRGGVHYSKDQITLPVAKYTYFSKKISRKTTWIERSQLSVLKEDIGLVKAITLQYDATKKYPHGTFADRVKMGYLDEVSNEPKYAVKIYKKSSFGSDHMHQLRVAMRSAYCYNLLGREGWAFRRNDKQYLVTDWQTGSNLWDADQAKIQSMPISRRIVMAISVLRELQILHELGLIHNDIKPDNMIVDSGKLGFVDLDSVHLKGEIPLHGKRYVFTPGFITPQLYFDVMYHPRFTYDRFDESTDLMAMGISFLYLFGDIYTPTLLIRNFKVDHGPVDNMDCQIFRVESGIKYKENFELATLLMKMLCADENSSQSAKEYIDEFMRVLKTYPDHEAFLKEDRLKDYKTAFSPEVGQQAFKEIEIELLGYNKRVNTFKKKMAI